MSKILLLAILLPAVAALIMLAKVILKPKKRVEPNYIEPDLDDGLKLVRKRMGDGLEEE